MSAPRPSGLKAPAGSKLAKPPTGIPQKSGLMPPGSLSKAQSAIAKSVRAAGLSSNLADKYIADAVHALAGEEEFAPEPQLSFDDFIIGDRVYVGDSKPGLIAFLGETQFAPGDWAGVVLDDMIGKNDGTVNGVRYFQCEPRHGVFCRISKLSRTPGIIQETQDAVSGKSVPVNGDNFNNTFIRRPTTPSLLMRPSTPSHCGDSRVPQPTTPSLPRPVNKSLSSSNSSLNKGHAPVKVKSDIQNNIATAMVMSSNNKLSVGDRVFVSGSKLGTLRYIGPADFAKGEWAGVELDDPLGKNDGAVAGKRYFDCRPHYGLFAPIHKVSKTSVPATSTPMTRSMGSTALNRSGSQESVSSLSSATSSASRPRVRLGVSGLGNNQQAVGRVGQRPSTLNITATTSALQKALKEKEEHIEQLLRERDLERSEVARAAAQVDEAQNQLQQLRIEKERSVEETDESIQQLRATVQKLLNEKRGLELKLEDEKRKVEDLQFQIEEEVISKDDLESRTEEEEAKMRELEKSLKQEKDKTSKLHSELVNLKMLTERHEDQVRAMEDTQNSYLDQIEELTHKLTQAELKIQTHDSSRVEEGAKTSQVSLDLEEKTAKVSELEDFLSLRNKEVKQLQEKLTELKDELDSRNSKQGKLQHSLEEMTDKFKAKEVFCNNLLVQIENFKSQTADLQRQLQSSNERTAQLTEEKSQMERQVADMMKNRGDSSNQLSMLNEQLCQKTRKIEDLQADLLISTQKWHSLNDKLKSSKREKEREIEIINANHDEIKSSIVNNLEDVKKELEKTKAKLLTIKKDLESEKANIIKCKDSEIINLKQQLETAAENLSQQEIQTQAYKQVLEKITMEKDAILFEKEKLEKHIKRLEAERDGLNTELVHLKVDSSKYQNSFDTLAKSKATVEEQLQDIKEEKEHLAITIAELQKSKEDLQADKEKLSLEKDQFMRELIEGQASAQHKDIMIEELQKDVEKLKQDISQHLETIHQLSQQTSDTGTMQKKIAEQTNLVELLRKQISAKDDIEKAQKQKAEVLEGEIKSLKIELEENQETVLLLEENAKDAEQEKENLRSQLQGALEARREQDKVLQLNQELNTEIETSQKRHKKDVEMLKSHCDSLQSEVDNFNSLLQQKDLEVKKNLLQITNLENENSMLISYKSTNEKLQKETKELRDKMNQLQAKVSESQSNANIINNKDVTAIHSNENNDLIAKLKEDHETAQGQILFLNSVIVDLQHKNDELKTRLQAMELGVTNGADESLELTTATKRSAPRVFCDICDVFDQHDTEDCPLQEMSDSPPPSHYHGDRHPVRPYCDICEEFHPPCPGLSIKKVSESSAEPIDPKSKVENWVKQVESVTSESEKVFENDGEFFHVHQGPSGMAFRDSGFYDVILDINPKLPFDTQTCQKAISNSMTFAEMETTIRDLNRDTAICKMNADSDTESKEIHTVDLLYTMVDDQMTSTVRNDLSLKVEMKKLMGVKCLESGQVSLAEHDNRLDKLNIESKHVVQIDNRSDKLDIENEHAIQNDNRPDKLDVKNKPAVQNDNRSDKLDVQNDIRPDKLYVENERVVHNDDRPDKLDVENERAVHNDNSNSRDLPTGKTSLSDSEYQSGNESPDLNTSIGTDISDMETSVDTGEVFMSQSSTEVTKQDKTGTDNKLTDSCVVS